MPMRKEYVPRAFAPIAQNFILENRRCNLWAGMGLGKTVLSLTAIDVASIIGIDEGPTLALGPLRVARDTWTTEASKWKHLREMKIVPIIGDLDERKSALRKKAHVYTMNYEQIPWLLEYLKGKPFPFKRVIADESTRLKGFRTKQGTKRARALSMFAFNGVENWLNLTGTPSPNGLLDLWGQQWFIDQGKRLGWTFEAFKERWFFRPANDYSRFSGSLQPFAHTDKEIQNLLRDCTLTLDPKDWFDLKEPIVTEIKVKLPPSAMKVYKQFEDTMYAELESGEALEVFNAAALTNKCRQIANGAVYLGPKQGSAADEEISRAQRWEPLHDAKLEALESIVEEAAGMPVLVAYSFKSDKERILKAFPKMVDISTERGLAAFKAGDAQGGVAHPKSMGHGIDGLQDVTNIIVRFGHDWNLEERLQMLERVGPVRQAQSGHDREVRVYDIIAEDTIDLDVIERHITKRSVQDILLASMKRAA